MFKKIKTKKLAKNILVTGLLIWAWAFAVTADYSSLSKTTWQTLTAANWNTLVNNVKWLVTDSNGDVIINQNLEVKSWIVEALAFKWDWSLLTWLDSLVWATGATWPQWEQWIQGLQWATWSVWLQGEQGLKWFTGATWPAGTTSWVDWDWVVSTSWKVQLWNNWDSSFKELIVRREVNGSDEYSSFWVIWVTWDTFINSTKWFRVQVNQDVDSNPDLYISEDTWNVWIWTTDPNYLLHVMSDKNETARFTSSEKSRLVTETTNDTTGDAVNAFITPSQQWNISVSSNDTKSYENDFVISDITNSKQNFTIKSNSWYVWIWTTTPTQALDVAWNIAVNWSTVHTSDRRFKEDIKNIDNSLDKISRINWVYYNWKDKDKFSSRHQIWVIAQEVEKEFPELVFTNDDWYKSVDYSKMVWPLIEAVKEQQKQIEELREEINILKN